MYHTAWTRACMGSHDLTGREEVASGIFTIFWSFSPSSLVHLLGCPRRLKVARPDTSCSTKLFGERFTPLSFADKDEKATAQPRWEPVVLAGCQDCWLFEMWKVGMLTSLRPRLGWVQGHKWRGWEDKEADWFNDRSSEYIEGTSHSPKFNWTSCCTDRLNVLWRTWRRRVADSPIHGEVVPCGCLDAATIMQEWLLCSSTHFTSLSKKKCQRPLEPNDFRIRSRSIRRLGNAPTQAAAKLRGNACTW